MPCPEPQELLSKANRNGCILVSLRHIEFVNGGDILLLQIPRTSNEFVSGVGLLPA
jgi:hypothetical protein